jgi:MOSC domain-containing protein YiiM
LLDELAARGFTARPGDLGEKILTRGLALLALLCGTLLPIGAQAVIQIAGLRNPCAQIDHFQPGFLKAVLKVVEDGRLIRKAGLMSEVRRGGLVRPNDVVRVELPPPPYLPLAGV